MGCGGGCGTEIEFSKEVDSKVKEKTLQHPCYSAGAHNFARMHLPVAPKCNISCNYCNRKYDCMNESRPGVTSEVLTPDMALEKYIAVKEKLPELKVVGIAGPGDALANFEETRKSIKLIKAYDPDVTFCLSTNGLMLPEYADKLMELGLHHITITINTLRPEIGAKIYREIIYKGKRYSGEEGSRILIDNQLKGLEMLVERGALVKVNIVMVKGINEQYIEEVAKKVKELGAFVTNIMPLIPAQGTIFEFMPLVSNVELNTLRKKCSETIQQMYHCQQCRADAIGKLKEDRSIEFRRTEKAGLAEVQKKPEPEKIRVAVASKTGDLIDQHFGHAETFFIYDYSEEKIDFIERRAVEKYCAGAECDDGDTKIDNTIKMLKDCKMVLSLRIGHEPKKKLMVKGIAAVETYDIIRSGIKNAVNAAV